MSEKSELEISLLKDGTSNGTVTPRMIEYAKEAYSELCKLCGREEELDGWNDFISEAMGKCKIPTYSFEDKSYMCCSCHINPPCSYCVDGGYCKEHFCMRIDCGCEV